MKTGRHSLYMILHLLRYNYIRKKLVIWWAFVLGYVYIYIWEREIYIYMIYIYICICKCNMIYIYILCMMGCTNHKNGWDIYAGWGPPWGGLSLNHIWQYHDIGNDVWDTDLHGYWICMWILPIIYQWFTMICQWNLLGMLELKLLNGGVSMV